MWGRNDYRPESYHPHRAEHIVFALIVAVIVAGVVKGLEFQEIMTGAVTLVGIWAHMRNNTKEERRTRHDQNNALEVINRQVAITEQVAVRTEEKVAKVEEKINGNLEHAIQTVAAEVRTAARELPANQEQVHEMIRDAVTQICGTRDRQFQEILDRIESKLAANGKSGQQGDGI
jgi:hypothetical protein